MSPSITLLSVAVNVIYWWLFQLVGVNSSVCGEIFSLSERSVFTFTITFEVGADANLKAREADEPSLKVPWELSKTIPTVITLSLQINDAVIFLYSVYDVLNAPISHLSGTYVIPVLSSIYSPVTCGSVTLLPLSTVTTSGSDISTG